MGYVTVELHHQWGIQSGQKLGNSLSAKPIQPVTKGSETEAVSSKTAAAKPPKIVFGTGYDGFVERKTIEPPYNVPGNELDNGQQIKSHHQNVETLVTQLTDSDLVHRFIEYYNSVKDRKWETRCAKQLNEALKRLRALTALDNMDVAVQKESAGINPAEAKLNATKTANSPQARKLKSQIQRLIYYSPDISSTSPSKVLSTISSASLHVPVLSSQYQKALRNGTIKTISDIPGLESQRAQHANEHEQNKRLQSKFSSYLVGCKVRCSLAWIGNCVRDAKVAEEALKTLMESLENAELFTELEIVVQDMERLQELLEVLVLVMKNWLSFQKTIKPKKRAFADAILKKIGQCMLLAMQRMDFCHALHPEVPVTPQFHEAVHDIIESIQRINVDQDPFLEFANYTIFDITKSLALHDHIEPSSPKGDVIALSYLSQILRLQMNFEVQESAETFASVLEQLHEDNERLAGIRFINHLITASCKHQQASEVYVDLLPRIQQFCWQWQFLFILGLGMMVRRGATSGIKRLALVEGLARYLRPVKRLLDEKRETSARIEKQPSDTTTSDPYLYAEDKIPVSGDAEPTWWYTTSSDTSNMWKLKVAIYHSLYEIYHTYRDNGLGKYAQRVLNANRKYETDDNVRAFLDSDVMYSFAPLKEFQPKSLFDDDTVKINTVVSSGISKMVLRTSLALAEESAECEDRDKFVEKYLRVCEKMKEQVAKEQQRRAETQEEGPCNTSDKAFVGELEKLKPESLRPEFQYEMLDKLVADTLPVFSDESYHNAYKVVVNKDWQEESVCNSKKHQTLSSRSGKLSTEAIEIKSSNVAHQDIRLKLRDPLLKIIETPAAGAANRRKMYDFRSVTSLSSGKKEKQMDKKGQVDKLQASLPPKSGKKDNLPASLQRLRKKQEIIAKRQAELVNQF